MEIFFSLKTPVAFFIFNRPDTTAKVFEEIRQARPPKLLVVADGPRPGNLDDKKKCEQTREILDSVDWNCEVIKNYSDTNLRCKYRLSSGLDWVFDTVEEAIILEDDCLPDQSFFRFSEELLHYYRNDPRIMHISGTNFMFGKKISDSSYYFSNLEIAWGWATWRRAWKNYDLEMKSFPLFRDAIKGRDIFNTAEMRRLIAIFEETYEGEIDTWDYQWLYSMLAAGGISIHPNVNLVQNIGFGEYATHTTTIDSKIKNNLANRLAFPIKHPEMKFISTDADQFILKNVICSRSFPVKISDFLERVLPKELFESIRNIKSRLIS